MFMKTISWTIKNDKASLSTRFDVFLDAFDGAQGMETECHETLTRAPAGGKAGAAGANIGRHGAGSRRRCSARVA